MKKILLATILTAFVTTAYAGWWEDSKEMAADAWQNTKEASVELKESAVEKWDEVTSNKDSKVESDNAGGLSAITKLGEKETYVKAWEGIKESAKNPSVPHVDENGIPKE